MNNSHTNNDIDLKNFFLMLWRRKILIILVMLLCVGAVFIYVKNIAPQYSATSSILIENNANSSVVLNEAEILKSRALARNVIDRLDLMNDPEFNVPLRSSKSNLLDKIFLSKDNSAQSDISDKFKHLSVYKTKINGAKQSNIDKNTGVVIDVFLEHINVRHISGSSVLQVRYNSTDPTKAALIANAIVDTYIEHNLNKNPQSFKQDNLSSDSHLEVLRNKVIEAENKAKRFKFKNDLYASNANKFNNQPLPNFNKQLVIAKIKEADAQAKLRQIQNWINNPDKIKMTKEAKSSPIIQTLKLKEAAILNEISSLSVRYGPKYPKMVSKQLELDETRDQIKQELTSIAKGIKANLKFVSNRVQAIKNTLGGVENVQVNGDDVHKDQINNMRSQELAREVEASQSALDTFFQTYKGSVDHVVNNDFQKFNARVISYATIPLHYYYPNKFLILSLALVSSFFIGVMLALLLEKMTSIFRTLEQLEKETGYTCLGLIPFVPKLDPNQPIADYIIGKGGSRMAEAMRTLRMVINLRAKNSEQKSKVITVTSCVPEEGKTTLSAWMARVAAKSGERVIVLDCDLRRPRLHTAFGKTPQNTIVEYLTGKCTLEEAIYRDPGTNMHAVFARSVPNNALDLLTKARMSNLIEALREQYDLIIIDSPACLSVSDARLLSSKSDQTVFAVSWSDTPIEVVNAGLKQFADVGNDALALVLTNVDMKQYSKYGFSEAVHYYSAYNPYYED